MDDKRDGTGDNTNGDAVAARRSASDTAAIHDVEIPRLRRIASGKVREIYEVSDDAILLVATDRISAFDVVLGQAIPDKGRVLTQISAFWFGQTALLIANHHIATEDAAIADALTGAGVDLTSDLRRTLAGRAMLCRRTQPLPVEAVVRGYLSGSAWAEYRSLAATSAANGVVNLWGHDLPVNLRESDPLPEPIFTPSTKATSGHDEPITWAETVTLVGQDVAEKIRDAAIALYRFAREYVCPRGILLADTKFEFGVLPNSELILIDEALTPDSSRFWEAALYAPGRAQASFDKQYVRDYLLSVPGWNRTPPAPDLPVDVILGTADRYREAYRRLVGAELPNISR